MTKPAPPLASIDPRMPSAVSAIVDRALAFENKDRWPDAAAMRDAVRRARTRIRGEVSSGASSPPVVNAATLLSVDPVHRTPGSETLRPTASEPRLITRARGLAATAVIVGGAIAVAAAIFVTRGPGPGATGTATSPTAGPDAVAPSATATPPAAPTITPGASATSATPAVSAAPVAGAAPSASAKAVVVAPPGSPGNTGARPRPPASAKPKADPLGKW